MNQVYRETNDVQPWNLSSVYKFRYRSVVNPHLLANKSLYQNEEMLASFGFPLSNFTVGEPMSQFVFVTAADRYHFRESMDGIASIQDLFPNKPIYFYDLTIGYLRSKVDKVFNKLITFCYKFNPQRGTLKMLRCRAPGVHLDPNCNSLNTIIFS